MFACFTFVSSQTYLVFFLKFCRFCICVLINVQCVLLIVCTSCIFVVPNVQCVLFNCLYKLHLCCHKRTMSFVQLFVQAAFVLSQTYNVFCSIVCISCICVVINVPLCSVEMFSRSTFATPQSSCRPGSH